MSKITKPSRSGTPAGRLSLADPPPEFRALVNSIRDYAVFLVDAAGRVESWSEGARALKGYDESEIVGQNFSRFFTGEDAAEGKPVALLDAAARDGRAKDEGWRVRRDGSRFWADVVISAVRDDTGHPVGFVIIVRDVTERRSLQTELLDRSAELASANEELEAFSYSVSHDLRAPLRAIDGFSTALMREFGDQMPPQGRQYLERIRRATARMSELIDDLLLLSRLTRAEIRPQVVNVGQMAVEILADLRKRDPVRTVDVVIDLRLQTRADPRLLRVVLENLIGNAWKFTVREPAARIEVGAASHAGRQEFFVRDNGVGFNMAHARQLFTPFQRLHPSEEFEGTGVGLATVRRIVARHGGSIRAESEPGKGATFWFTLGGQGG